MRASTTLLRAMTDIRDSYILEGELPEASATMLPRPDRFAMWKRFTSSGWFVAAICAVVAVGTLAGIVLAGRNAPSVQPPVETQESETAEDVTEAPTEEILEEVTNFPVLTDAAKSWQRVYHNEFKKDEFYVLPWDIAGTADECPYTAAEVLASISLGDNIMDVYDRIGYPTYRDTASTFLSGRNLDLFTMDYRTADRDTIFITYRLAGCTAEDYRYVVTAISSSKKTIPYTAMDFDTKVRLQVIPVFMAVEDVGVEYLLEREIITPYEATLYAAEEAVYQERLASQAATE
jgi:hypothetical protein